MNLQKIQRAPWPLCVSLALATVGCADGATPDDGHVAVVQQPIAGGGAAIITGALGVVDFTLPDPPDSTIPNNCTGSMIAPNVVLTAAHCFKLALPGLTAHQTSGTFETKVSYYDPIIGRRTVFDSATDGLATWRARDYHFDADFPGDANDDIGVVIIPGTFRDTDYHDYKRLYDDIDDPLEDTLRAYGAGIYTWSGWYDDLLRRATFDIENVAPEHIIADNQSAQICGGDSGGPLVKVVSSSLELVAGITSLNEHNPDSKFCADDTPFFGSTGGDNTAYLKVSNNLGWIQNTVGLTCARLSSSLFYRRCFQIPFIEDVAFEGLSRDAETAIAMALL